MPTRALSERSLKPGDHAYVAPPFHQRGGSPYLIVRILDLPPTPPGGIPTVKVAYYLRRRDVTNRSLADHRVIFATFMDGVVPLSHVRQKVQVMYRDYLEDPEAFKKQPDSFVFHQIYDRFMHKPFDLVPTSQVMNAPDHVLEHIRSNYEFVCTELGSAPGLCDAMRGCIACHGFAAKDDSVTCTICGRTWHLGCVEPPLAKKPALGWRWSCITCTMEQEDDSSDADSVMTPNSDRLTARTARKKAKPITALKNGKADKGKGVAVKPQLDVAKWKSLNGWPYRYFGEHVHYESVLDPHDPIWPRASTSVGSRYQCTDIPGEDPDPSIRRGPMPKKRRGRKKGSEQQIEPERGVDEACEIIWRPDASTSEVVLEDMLNPVKSKSIANKQGNVDLIVDALRLINVNRGPQAAQSKVAELLQQHPYHASLVQWSDVDSNIFDLDLEDHEDELGRYTRTRKVKSYPEIVHHYYREKGYQKRFMHLEDPAQDKFAAAGPQGIEGEHGDLTIDGEQEDDDGSSSVVEDIPPSSGRKVKHHCAMCGTDKTDIWYHCPEGLGHQDEGQKDHVVCSSCSIQWRHYGNTHPVLSEAEMEARAAKDGRRGRPPASARRSASPGTGEKKHTSDKPYGRLVQHADGTYVTVPVKSCVMCKRPEPRATNFECHKCGLSVHSGCYGIDEHADPENWECEGCLVAESQADVPPYCKVCPKPEEPLALLQGHSAVDAYKRDISADSRGLVHLLCALWHHEMVFEDPAMLSDARSETDAFRNKSHLHCTICNKDEGACVKCDSCPNTFHISCAWSAGYRFSFEILPFKEEWRNELGRTATFKEETGDMRALVLCKGHPWTYSRLLYDLGQKDRGTDLTALMTFSRYAKSSDLSQWIRHFRNIELGLLDTETLPLTKLPHAVLADVYETKAPYSKPVKVKRKRTTTAKSGIIDAPLSNVHSAPNGLASATNLDTNTNSSASVIVKKRKRKNSDSSQGGSLSTTSEDEVMPTASTTRARGAARQTRGVSLKDILIDENEPVVSKHAAHRAKSSRPGGMESGSEVKWGYSQIVDGREVWHHVDEENLRQMLFPAQNASQEPKPPLVKGQAQASALENGTPNGYNYAQEEEAVTMPMPKWQVLTLPSLMHACRESMRHRQQQRTSTPTTTSLQYTASASSNATVPIRPSPTDFGKVANRLQATPRTSITPVPMAKVESANGSLPPEGAPNTLPY